MEPSSVQVQPHVCMAGAVAVEPGAGAAIWDPWVATEAEEKAPRTGRPAHPLTPRQGKATPAVVAAVVRVWEIQGPLTPAYMEQTAAQGW